MGSKKVYLRADGNNQTGLGHIYRLLGLSEVLSSHFDLTFIIQQPSSGLRQLLLSYELRIVELVISSDYIKEAKELSESFVGDEIVVLDGYHFDTNYQSILKQNCKYLVCIDDHQPYHYVCDSLINHNGGVHANEISCESYTSLHIGPRYSLLRPAFVNHSKTRNVIKPFKHCFVCLGGTDFYNLTPLVLGIGLQLETIETFHIISSLDKAAYSFLDAAGKEYDVYRNLNDKELSGLITRCDVALTSASVVSYECCAVGIPLYIGYYAENQHKLYDYLVNEKLAGGLGLFSTDAVASDYHFPENDPSTTVQRQRQVFNSDIFNNVLSIFKNIP